jgi:hypothetical protein
MASIPPLPLPAVTLTENRAWTIPSRLNSFVLPSIFSCSVVLRKISPLLPTPLPPEPYPAVQPCLAREHGKRIVMGWLAMLAFSLLARSCI